MRLVAILLFMLPLFVQAQEKEFVELQSRVTQYNVNIRLNEDFTVERISEYQVKALTDEVTKQLKRRQFSHSTSIEKLEVLEAYTLKANGKKIPVPKDNYQITVNKGRGGAGAIFSDRTSVGLVFTELEKNDSVYVRIKNTETEPMFPGQFATSAYFYNQNAYDDVRVQLDLPESVKYSIKVKDMKEKSYRKNGRRIIELHYENKKPLKSKREDFSVWDATRQAGYAISTFTDYSAIAKAYAARALPKAEPTARIKALAKEIIKDEKDKKNQARLLYDWVARNISYAGNCIGVGAVVPHDTDFILDNRMGDCKDHATLLEALYRTVGIESTQALINAGSTYRLPSIPLVTAVNHVINYIPEWDQFVDSTNPEMPFDQLAFSLQDKPVILVDGSNPGKKTPAMRFGDNSQELVTTMNIQDDGSVEGDIQISLKGLPAVEARQGWRGVTETKEKEWLEKVFSTANKTGFGSISKDDPEPLLSEFNYTFKFKKPEFVLPKGAGGFYIAPLIKGPKGVLDYISFSQDEINGYDIACGNGHARQRLVYKFPKSMKILAKPDDFEINENHLHYRSKHTLQGNTLTVEREMRDTTPGNVCPPDLVNRQRSTLIKVAESLKSQVIYQH